MSRRRFVISNNFTPCYECKIMNSGIMGDSYVIKLTDMCYYNNNSNSLFTISNLDLKDFIGVYISDEYWYCNVSRYLLNESGSYYIIGSRLVTKDNDIINNNHLLMEDSWIRPNDYGDKIFVYFKVDSELHVVNYSNIIYLVENYTCYIPIYQIAS